MKFAIHQICQVRNRRSQKYQKLIGVIIVKLLTLITKKQNSAKTNYHNYSKIIK